MTPGKLQPASNVSIVNCILGRSSHHGIHGNSVKGVSIENVTIKDFEVGGISLNDVRHVNINTVKIGPSMRMTFSAFLSQAIFLDHMTNVVGMGDPVLKTLIKSTSFLLRGKKTSAAAVYEKLNVDLNKFLEGRKGDLADLIGPLGLPDGSAIYGIVIHKSGPAIGDFGSCPMKDFIAKKNSLVGDVRLTSIEVHDLAVAPEAWISLKHGGRPVMGPAGAVFRATHLNGSSGEYLGNPLADAIIATAHVLNEAKAFGEDSALAQRASEYFGAANIPEEILNWAAEGKAKLDFSTFGISCSGDSMSHFNKGVVGIRLEYLSAPMLENIKISKLENFGGAPEDESMCKAPYYKGNDVRALKLTNCAIQKHKGLWPKQIVQASDLVPGYAGKQFKVHVSRT
jgi:hypothetical protein